MQELWGWLGGNSSPWDAIGSIGVVLVAIVLGVALSRQARAAIAQAKGAKSHLEEPDRHISTGVAFADRETYPNNLIGAATGRDGAARENTIAILNMGGGVAKNLRLRYRDQPSTTEIPLAGRALAIRDVLPVAIDSKRGVAYGFRLSYSTDFGTRFALEFDWDGRSSRAFNEKLIVISPGSPAPES